MGKPTHDGVMVPTSRSTEALAMMEEASEKVAGVRFGGCSKRRATERWPAAGSVDTILS